MTQLHAMADHKAASTFMSLPLEVRHNIFEHAAVGHVKPKKLLRYWFEKKEVKAVIAEQVAKNPDLPIPRLARVEDQRDTDSEVAEDDGEEEHNLDSDEGEDEEEDEPEANADDEDEDEADQEAASSAIPEQDADMTDQEEDETIADEHQTHSGANTQSQSSAQTPTLSTVIVATQQSQPQVGADGHTVDPAQETAETEVEAEAETHHDESTVDEDGDETMDEENHEEDETATTAQPPRPPTPVIYPHGKWRHIPNFMRLTQCPPPVELLLTSKQLNNEVKNWYYDVAVLRIEATGSFAHTSFFEEAFSQITEAAFSPMENIRKVEVTFVWDTTWIRADDTGCIEAIFPALLRQRSTFVYQILTQAPDLKEVVIHWHDSAQDGESTGLRMDILEPFDNLPANIKIVEHYIPVASKPDSRSIAGKRRVEFQTILDNGLDRLF